MKRSAAFCFCFSFSFFLVAVVVVVVASFLYSSRVLFSVFCFLFRLPQSSFSGSRWYVNQTDASTPIDHVHPAMAGAIWECRKFKWVVCSAADRWWYAFHCNIKKKKKKKKKKKTKERKGISLILLVSFFLFPLFQCRYCGSYVAQLFRHCPTVLYCTELNRRNCL